MTGSVFIPAVLEGEADGLLFYTDEPDTFSRLKRDGKCAVPVLTPEFSISDSRYAITGPEDMDLDGFVRIYRRLKGLPWVIAHTERTLIREMTEADEGCISLLYREGDYPGIEPVASITDYRKNIYGFYEYGIWLVFERETGRLIGRAGLSPSDRYEYPDIGYMISPAYRRQSYGYEVCQKVLDYASGELGFDRIGAVISPDNTPSIGFIKKLGFERMEVTAQGTEQLRIEADYWIRDLS